MTNLFGSIPVEVGEGHSERTTLGLWEVAGLQSTSGIGWESLLYPERRAQHSVNSKDLLDFTLKVGGFCSMYITWEESAPRKGGQEAAVFSQEGKIKGKKHDYCLDQWTFLVITLLSGKNGDIFTGLGAQGPDQM